MTVPLALSLESLEKFRSYLSLLARLNLDPRLQGKLDASDLVQDVMLKAVQTSDQFKGTTEAEIACWLRQILANHLANRLRDLRREKRDIAREQGIQAAIDASSIRLESWLATEQSSPSMRAEINEQLLQLAAAITRLPDAQREALTLHHLGGWTLDAISKRMERSPVAVAGLIKRGLRQLRDEMNPSAEA